MLDTAGGFFAAANVWSRIKYDADALVPPKRSSFQWVPEGPESVLLVGGYCKVVPPKKSKGPPKIAGTQAVEPTEEDEFEQLGRGVTYTDVWRLSTKDYSWARVPTSGEVSAFAVL